MDVATIPDFFEHAAQMRSEFEAMVGPQRCASPQRFRWDYWHVPGQFTYMRTLARTCFSSKLYSEFAITLRRWALQNLGCAAWTDPWLSYYISGCRQEFHSDVLHGPWAWVFSLTKWTERSFSGGETVLIAPQTLDYWKHFDPKHPQEHDQILRRVAPNFNQLTVFDGRIPHAVAPIEGTMDPLDSRVVIHGWFLPPTARTEGALTFEDIETVLASMKEKWDGERARWGRLNGSVTIRLKIGVDGVAGETEVVASNLISLDFPEREQEARKLAVALASSSRYPESAGTTLVTIPFIAEGP
jgi:hypothetical protein